MLTQMVQPRMEKSLGQMMIASHSQIEMSISFLSSRSKIKISYFAGVSLSR